MVLLNFMKNNPNYKLHYKTCNIFLFNIFKNLYNNPQQHTLHKYIFKFIRQITKLINGTRWDSNITFVKTGATGTLKLFCP